MMTEMDGRNHDRLKSTPWLWIPTLYFAEGIPYFIVNVISVIMFKRLGMGNGDIAMYTGLLYLPWVIKPLWSPFVDIIRTKRWWVVTMQILMSVAFAAAAFSIPGQASLSDFIRTAAMPSEAASGVSQASAPVSLFVLTLVIFWITAFASATHDIAADGFYMLALDKGEQSFFVGIRSTFYRLSSVFGQGVLVVAAGLLETRLENIPLAWSLTLLACALLFAALTFYHIFVLPRPVSDAPAVAENKDCELQKTPSGGNHVRQCLHSRRDGGSLEMASDGCGGAGSRTDEYIFSGIVREFGKTFATFFRKRHVWMAIVFMLLYRLPEAFLVKMLNPFLLDPVSEGGLGLSTETVGIVYGTAGVIALTLGGIVGGMAASRWGLKRSMWPMALSLALPCLVFLYLAVAQPSDIWIISSCVVFDQFGYGFGFTAYMLYMMYFAEGEFKTSHYSICTAFMALSMMLPGMVAGYLQEWLGYVGFFWMVAVCCMATVGVTLFVKVDPEYGVRKAVHDDGTEK